MSAETLREALREAGLDCEVEARGALAVFRASDEAATELADDDTRARAVALATAHGFTHAAVELRD